MKTHPTSLFISLDDRSQQGFTLIELSIVLVVIGLLVGGIVAATSMVANAEIRRFINQIDSYQLAVKAFQTKYDSLPGDMRSADAATAGFAARAGSLAHGDGDGIVTGGGTLNGTTPVPLANPALAGETSLFWNDLSVSGMVKGNYAGSDTSGGSGGNAALADTTAIAAVVPVAPLAPNMFISVYGDFRTNANYFVTVGNAAKVINKGAFAATADTSTSFLNIGALTPLQAYSIDSKIDDGMPLSGVVSAINNVPYGYNDYVLPALFGPAAPATGVCVSNASGNPYNTSPATGGNAAGCALRIGMQ